MSAPSQAPRLAALIGWPVGHSLSPAIHRIWAAREGANAHYIPVAVAPDDAAFRRAVEALRTLGFSGCNVTLPHKERALALADTVSDEARAAGAANMLTFTTAGVVADNSDIDGLARSLQSVQGRSRVLLLGAGGAARGAIIALKERLGFAEVVVANRTEARARALAPLGVHVVPWEERSAALVDADLLVNATSLGMAGADALDIDLAPLAPAASVCDIVYMPLETPLLADARRRGLHAIDGLEMLMHQAVKGWRTWLGTSAVVDADLRRGLLAALAQKPTGRTA